jgi:hypothetical protein
MVVFGTKREVLEQQFASVVEVSRTTNKWGQPYESMPIYVCRDAKQNLLEAWPKFKKWL